jgi:hypothetical protein
MNSITISPRHGFSESTIPAYRGGAAETIQNLKTELTKFAEFFCRF